MLKHFRIFFLILTLSFSGQIFSTDLPQPVKSEIVSEETSIQPGKPFWVAVKLDIDEGWHAYWKNPGANGFSPSIEWNLPDGFEVSQSEWPYPERMEVHEGVVYGYHEILTLLAEVTPPADLTANSIDLNADLAWLVCSDTTCLPGKHTLSLTLPVSSTIPEKNLNAAGIFSAARERHPVKHHKLQAQLKEQKIDLELSDHKNTFSHAYFYPEENGIIQDSKALTVSTEANQHKFTLPLHEEGQESSDAVLKGVLVLHNHDEVVNAIHVEVPVHKGTDELAMAEISAPPPQTESYEFQGGFLWALVFAFLGGLILNLMPCVLPVISLKIFSFVKMAGENRWKIMKHGLLFTLGVLVSFWVLAGALIALQTYGQVVGWGFQLQEPIFVAILAVILYVFGLSLFGMFEVGTMFSSWAGQKQSDATKNSGGGIAAFLSGILATTVATPCTGPFLGPAIGFAMTLSAPLSLMIFTALALGMSFPYLLISAFPPLIKFLPKPGNWMITFKEILGFFMVATALWLVWVFGAQTGFMAIFGLLIGLFIMTFACWVYGKWGTPMSKRPVRMFAYIAALAIAAGGLYLVVEASKMSPAHDDLIAMADTGHSGADIRKWESYSPERLSELRKQGKPVFVDFTAKWCLICQANHLVLQTSEVSDKLAELGVVKMLADWTKNNPVITEALRQYGRSGVPLYLLFGPDGEPEVLPQMLTPDVVLDYLEHVNI